MKEVKLARDYLERATEPVSLNELREKTGVSSDEIAALERNGVVVSFYRLANKDVSLEKCLACFSSEPFMSEAEKTVEYLKRDPDRIIRRDEVSHKLGISNEDSLYVLSGLEKYSLAIPYYELSPPASCEICFYRIKCKKDIPAGRCNLFTDDYRLAV